MKSYHFAYSSVSRAVITAMLSVSLCVACAQHTSEEQTDFYTKMDFAPLDDAPSNTAYKAGIDELHLSLADKAVYAMAAAKSALEDGAASYPYLSNTFPEQATPRALHFDSDVSKLDVEAFNTETSDANLLVNSGTLLCQDGQTKKGMYSLDRNAAVSTANPGKLGWSEGCRMPARVKLVQKKAYLGVFHLP